jgi:hypothetical protein
VDEITLPAESSGVIEIIAEDYAEPGLGRVIEAVSANLSPSTIRFAMGLGAGTTMTGGSKPPV